MSRWARRERRYRRLRADVARLYLDRERGRRLRRLADAVLLLVVAVLVLAVR